MKHPHLYIIAGPTGAGKTTASYTLLPEMLNCINNTKDMSEREFETKVREGLKITYRRVVEQHRRDNQPLVFSENGVVQFVDPYTVQI